MLLCASCLFLLRTGDIPDLIFIHPTPNMAGYFFPLFFFHFRKTQQVSERPTFCASTCCARSMRFSACLFPRLLRETAIKRSMDLLSQFFTVTTASNGALLRLMEKVCTTALGTRRAFALRFKASMLPTSAYCTAGASQLLKPALTIPRSYGRRHWSWQYEPQAQANC